MPPPLELTPSCPLPPIPIPSSWVGHGKGSARGPKGLAGGGERTQKKAGGWGGRREGLEWTFEFFFQNLETSGLDIPSPQDARSESWYLEKLGLGGFQLGAGRGSCPGFCPHTYQ